MALPLFIPGLSSLSSPFIAIIVSLTKASRLLVLSVSPFFSFFDLLSSFAPVLQRILYSAPSRVSVGGTLLSPLEISLTFFLPPFSLVDVFGLFYYSLPPSPVLSGGWPSGPRFRTRGRVPPVLPLSLLHFSSDRYFSPLSIVPPHFFQSPSPPCPFRPSSFLSGDQLMALLP